ncbi:MAG TPA: hypothetical protein VM491_23540, partial [Burkholderiaceae bacterium]|nr:hypothetical protein [Burkholderiaceae bacterium]
MHHLRTLISVAVAAALTQGFAAAQQASANGSPNTARAAAATNQGDPSVAQQATITAPVAVGETLIVKGTVEAIDKDKRRVTLKGDDGRTIRMYVGQGIPNFDKIKSGDRVTARFTEAVALSLAEGTGSDIRSRVEAEAGRVAEKGKPGVQDLERSTIVANVMDVDRNAGSVTLRGVSGEPIRLKVQDKQALKDIDAGDQIVATFVESAAVSIEAGATSAGGQPSSGADSGAQARA